MEWITLKRSDEGIISVLEVKKMDNSDEFNLNFITNLDEALEGVQLDTRVQAAVITGPAGVFCNGFDSNPFRETKLNDPNELLNHYFRDLTFLTGFEQPLATLLDGEVRNTALDICLLADYRSAEAEAKFIFEPGDLRNYVRYLILSRSVGDNNARRICLGGETISAKKALEIGLIQSIEKKKEQRKGALKWLQNASAMPEYIFGRIRRDFLRMIRNDSLDGQHYLKELFSRLYFQNVYPNKEKLESHLKDVMTGRTGQPYRDRSKSRQKTYRNNRGPGKEGGGGRRNAGKRKGGPKNTTCPKCGVILPYGGPNLRCPRCGGPMKSY